MEKDKRIYTLAEEKPAIAVLKMGVPLTMGMMIMVLYNIVDTFFIGMLHDDYQLAAVNLAYPIMMVMMALSNMIGTGAASLIARSMGAGDNDKAEHTLTVGIELTFVLSALLTFFGLTFRTQLIHLLGAKTNTIGYTTTYVTVLLVCSFFTMANFIFGQLLRSEGSAKYSIIGMVVGTVVNIILDPVFIFVLGMEIRGAAIATVLGNAFGTVVSISMYIRKKSILQPSLKYLRPTAEILKEIFWVGVPATLETMLTTVAYVVVNNLAVSYGELTVAAMGIAQKIMTVGTYVYQGFASGTQPIMGYNYGAGNFKRMLSVLKAGVVVLCSIELCIMAVIGVFAPVFIGLFSQSAEVIAIGTTYIRANMFILLFVGSISMSRISFQAMGKPQFAFAITLVRQLILYIPLLLVFNHFGGFHGMIWAQPVTECIMMISSVTLLAYKLKAYMTSAN